MRVEIWSDIACPWCYIGKARFEAGLAAFAHRDRVEVVHRSFELDPKAPAATDVPVLDMLAAKYGVTREQAEAMEARVAEAAAGEGLGYRSDRIHGNTFDLHRLLHAAAAHGVRDAVLDAFYRANFAEARTLGDPAVLRAVAVGAGLPAEETDRVLADPGAYAREVRADEREAAELGATGVPFFVIDRRYGISGGQPAEVFRQALERAHEDAPAPPAAGGEAAVCGDDGCAVPGK
ncbi:DsbA family oxidoreductase [Streptomyces angustmyceticus]|uniref:DSBA oxidoreductase n=2 Tax=Streptomyces angustmyceticus TaxID=285578 RepID=A0A5J4LL42_9ACTN|nr:DsbA family oxidoreductase [Streptomyces angustmyceticus]UAL69826.1 DsbA family oxidoreductase [Streptomyces angustmyceticus]GES32701.1 DSBA oxidoreductase [Streptomyces angustmyceticus]